MFDGTPIQSHEVDLINLIRMTSKDVNESISEISGIENNQYMSPSVFEDVFSNQKIIEELVKRSENR